ncbi:RNA polymerase sigma factor [Candidatus Uabimicrobium amorphum]|uniref:Ecf-type RNA polymerase sigma factor n=1 Tax=Uabimicrobium amorphum TaxID=2596890 RepID=A0A5S9IIX8_UABAM|nr:RNA polymerase sigma factor [Candidatus Uabimicrobium amorphum]BBM82306.1 Ecf-type RNA polymerase sigma factor [Candidatus Uabimicrobium amorphum]
MVADETLMQQVISGDSKAADALLERYKKPLYSFIFRMTVNESDSDDLFQETWLRVIRYCRTFNPQKKFSTWLFQIAANCTRDFFRNKKNFVSLEEAPPAVHEEKSSLENSEWARKLMKNLPVYQREVVVLKFFHSKKEREIAEILDIPIGTVKSRLHKAMNYLKGMHGEQ